MKQDGAVLECVARARRGAIVVSATLASSFFVSIACAQQLPSASPGAPCAVPGTAATYGINGMLICSASMTWKPGIPASTPSNDGGLTQTVSQRFGRAMASIVDGTADFVQSMLAP